MNKSKITILVIDDEQSFLDIITNNLKDYDYKVLQALNGDMGCSVASKFLPDIIICDWEMPVMNGIEAIIKLKKQNNTKDIPVIMATGAMTTSENLETALSAGAIDYIRKPIDSIELTARINSTLKLANSYKEITNQRDQLKILNATKDKFFSIIAHDLKSPLNSILGFTDLLLRKYDKYSDEKRKIFIHEIGDSSKSTFYLLENLLNWARSQSGKIEIIKERINLSEIVNTCVDNYSRSARNKNIKVTIEIPNDITIVADKFTLSTTIGNLINNAVKFTPEGGRIRISCSLREAYIDLNIEDTGVGIHPLVIDKLFRIDESHSTEGTNQEKGTGLGLILCKEFIDKNNGSIRIKSEVGKGSEFIVSIPN